MCGKLRREGGRRERFHFIIQDLDIFLRGYSCRTVSKIKDGTGNSTRLLLPTPPSHVLSIILPLLPQSASSSPILTWPESRCRN